MKLAKPITTSLGAVALTLIAAGSALAVNIGILSQNGTSAVGALDTVTSTTAVAASQPSPQFIYVNLNDPTQAVTAVDQTTAPQVAPAAATNLVNTSLVNTGEQEYEGAEYDD
ncbi:MAG: hypothetical protein WBV06_00185 [Acidimicrobiia bacterium]